MKKFLMTFVLLSVFSVLSAQVSVDPTDRFYEEAQGWELKGYIEPLPLIRPYPSTVIRSVLDQVINCSDKKDAEVALSEFERIFGQSYSVYVYGMGQYKTSQDQADKEVSKTKNIKGEGGFAGEIVFHPLVTMGFDLGMYAEITDFDDISPYYMNKAEDSIFDPTDVGPIAMYLDWNTNITAGTKNVYMTAGISKTGYGPFLNDGLALNDTTFHSANIMFNVTRSKWSYASTFEIIGATSNNPDEYNDHSSGKYLSFHVGKYRVNKYLDVSYYENILFGPQLNLAYLFPAPYMPVQNIGGANDNLQMGLMIEIKPVPGVNWATDIFVDDLEMNDLVKLHFDTKIRVGGQTGIIYSPVNSNVKKMALNYQMVLPYVYSHWEYKSDDSGYIGGECVNYQNYSNSGVHIGSVLDPNSDKVSFKATFQPKPNIRINFGTNFIRHCNSAEAFDFDDAAEYVLSNNNQYITDGSLYMHQMFSDPEDTSGIHVDQAWESLGFMTSDHKMGVLQANLKAEYDFPKTRRGKLSLFADYSFEIVKNKGVNKNLYKGCFDGKNYKLNGAVYTVNSNEDGTKTYIKDGSAATIDDFTSDLSQEISNQKEKWINNLSDKVNHYLTLGFRYTF